MIETINPEHEHTLQWWRELLKEEDLVNRSVLIVKPYYCAPELAIPVGTHRRAGYVTITDEPLRQRVFEELRLHPLRFPDLRMDTHRSSDDPNLDTDIAWGDDISSLWSRREDPSPGMAREAHRAIGRAFGYKESRILSLYPDAWEDKSLRSD